MLFALADTHALSSVRTHWGDLQPRKSRWLTTANTSDWSFTLGYIALCLFGALPHVPTCLCFWIHLDIYLTSEVWQPASASSISSCAAPWCSTWGMNGRSSSTPSSNPGSTTSQCSRTSLTSGTRSQFHLSFSSCWLYVWWSQHNATCLVHTTKCGTGKKNKNNLQRPFDINTFHFLRELLQFAKDNDAIAQEIAMR